MEAVRAILEEKSMPKFYWVGAVRTVIYIQNRIGEKVSAHEQYFGRKPNLRHLRVFGSIVYVHVSKEKRRKLDTKAEKCNLVGYSNKQKGYKCYNPRTKQARVSRDVVSNESASWCLPPTPDLNSNPSSEDEINEAEMHLDERETETLEESLVSFRLSGLNVQLSRFDQSDEELASSGDSAVNSPRKKPRRWFTHKEKRKKKMSEYDTDRDELDQRTNRRPIWEGGVGGGECQDSNS